MMDVKIYVEWLLRSLIFPGNKASLDLKWPSCPRYCHPKSKSYLARSNSQSILTLGTGEPRSRNLQILGTRCLEVLQFSRWPICLGGMEPFHI